MHLLFSSFVLAQATQPAASQPAPSIGSMIQTQLPFFALAFLIIYFLMIRPQRNQQRTRQEMLANLKKGDNIITTSGIHGRVVGVADKILTVEIAENVRIKIERDGVSIIKSEGNSEEKAK